MRRMFLSYTQLAVVGEDVFSRQHQPHTTELKGYLYLDPDSALCLRVENIYVELSPSLLQDLTKAKKG